MKRTLFLLLLLLLTACGQAQEEPATVQKTNFQMDTVVTITLYDWTDDTAIDRAFQEISRLEALLSVEKEGSDLDRLAKAAGQDWVEIAPETQEVLELAKEYYTISDEMLDVTAGPLIDLWDINSGGHYPAPEELDAVLPLIGSDRLLVEDGRAYLADPGMKANLGAVAKGYIADRVRTCSPVWGWSTPCWTWAGTSFSSAARPRTRPSASASRTPTGRRGRCWPFWRCRTKAL